MTGGESEVSRADVDRLMLDFMRVIRATHQLHSSDELGFVSDIVWLNVGSSAPLFTSLGLKPQLPEMQWMLLIKLFRELCISEVVATYKNGKPLNQDKLMMDYFIDYTTLEDEVMVRVNMLPFEAIEKRLNAVSTTSQVKPATPAPQHYNVRLWSDDTKLIMYINGEGFQVAYLGDDSQITKLLVKLMALPDGRVMTASDFTDKPSKFNFKQLINSNRFKWLLPLLSVSEPRRIALRNPSELELNEMRSLVKQINAIYRTAIEEHLGFVD